MAGTTTQIDPAPAAKMGDAELIELVKTAYKSIGKIPSRNSKLDSDTYAGAIHALIQYERLSESKFIAGQTMDWQNGFDNGFEWSNGEPRWAEFERGVRQGLVVAKAIFSWEESPNIYHPRIAREIDREKRIYFLQEEVKELRKMLVAKQEASR